MLPGVRACALSPWRPCSGGHPADPRRRLGFCRFSSENRVCSPAELRVDAYGKHRAERRAPQEIGKNVARRARAAGKVPAVVYGAKKETVPIYYRGAGPDHRLPQGRRRQCASTLLKMAGTGSEPPRDDQGNQRDPRLARSLHVDFVCGSDGRQGPRPGRRSSSSGAKESGRRASSIS